ncbi:MAG TPA: glycerate kinase [Cyanobacteria bacterium UBA8803]|nr:glycerate kinase [Cyanobacteria bacterium UBA9273]HBL58669.1 glycerate kinase [Cyanobacteria bacterium UBA8803]
MTQNDLSLGQILNNWVAGEAPNELAWERLAAVALASPRQAKAFGITPTNVEEMIAARSHLFQSTYRNILLLPSFCQSRGQSEWERAEAINPITRLSSFQSQILLSLWNLWLPLAMQLAAWRQQLGHPLIQGILGGQGTGKTTLGAVLSLILAQLGYRTFSLSLDDLYKTYAERQSLQKQDPRLIWRGPPGTHDVELGLQVLGQLRSPLWHNPVLVPRFDKSAWGGAGDRTEPEIVEGIDIVLFEGWFVGVQPIDPATFDAPTPAPIDTDGDRAFARDMNERLEEYLPLWERLDRLMVLYPTDYRLSLQWRRQAEEEMMATGKSGMNGAQVEDFVKYFWKSLHPELFITPLIRDADLVDLVIEINCDRTIGEVYRPI